MIDLLIFLGILGIISIIVYKILRGVLKVVMWGIAILVAYLILKFIVFS